MPDADLSGTDGRIESPFNFKAGRVIYEQSSNALRNVKKDALNRISSFLGSKLELYKVNHLN